MFILPSRSRSTHSGNAGSAAATTMNQIEFFAALRECVAAGGTFDEFANSPADPAGSSSEDEEEIPQGFGGAFRIHVVSSFEWRILL